MCLSFISSFLAQNGILFHRDEKNARMGRTLAAAHLVSGGQTLASHSPFQKTVTSDYLTLKRRLADPLF